jgi:glucokinase
MTQLLAGDIGGTKTILRLTEVDGALPGGATPHVLYEQAYPSQAYPDLAPLVQAFVGDAAAATKLLIDPVKACFGVAGPVVNNRSNVTNLGWDLTGDRLAMDLHLDKVSLINDFAAVGYGVLGLTAADVCTLQAGQPDGGCPIAVIGAGTGLGQAFLIPQRGHYEIFATEGGHKDFAPRSALEFRLMTYLRKQLGVNRVSVERVVSGTGITSIYQFLRDSEGMNPDREAEAVVSRWEQGGVGATDLDPSAAIAAAARDRQDPMCQAALNIFVEAYGVEAGNCALNLLPYGGVYLAGGVAAKNLELMKNGLFMEAFLEKGRMQPLMEQMPVHVVLNQKVGLIGAALYAASL